MNSPLHPNRRSVLRLLGTTAASAPFITRNLIASPPSSRVRHAAVGTSGMAGADLFEISSCPNVEVVALCDVDVNRAAEARKRHPNATFYQDWRKMFEIEGARIDSVHVSTPDHMHAPAAARALSMKKHVYGQKPLAHDVWETRRLADLAARSGVVTQMGIQMHASSSYRTAVAALRSGILGAVREIHLWSSKSWGDTTPLPDHSDPVPDGFDWDLWLGVCAKRPFLANGYYHPANWRKRLDFGTGTLGDMGCHIFDPVFEALDLRAPLTLRSDGPRPNASNWANDGHVLFTFPATPRTAATGLNAHWYDGAARPPKEVSDLVHGTRWPSQGSLLIGSAGVMLLPHTASPIVFLGSSDKPERIPEMPGHNHWQQFVSACRGEGKTDAPFAFAAPLTETILLGGIASRFPNTTLHWDSPSLRFQEPEANAFVRKSYRDGWNLPELQ